MVRLGGGGGRGLEGDDDSSWGGGGRPSLVRNSGGSAIPSPLTSKSASAWLLQGNGTLNLKEGSLPRACGVHWCVGVWVGVVGSSGWVDHWIVCPSGFCGVNHP